MVRIAGPLLAGLLQHLEHCDRDAEGFLIGSRTEHVASIVGDDQDAFVHSTAVYSTYQHGLITTMATMVTGSKAFRAIGFIKKDHVL